MREMAGRGLALCLFFAAFAAGEHSRAVAAGDGLGQPKPVSVARFTSEKGCTPKGSEPGLLTIAEVQGDGSVSPHRGAAASIAGVVTGCVDSEDGVDGCFVQSAAGDGDPSTSEGIYLLSRRRLPAGHRILAVGRVVEHFGMTALSGLRRVQDCGPGAAPTAADLALAPGVQPDLEPFEGMLVRVPGTLMVVENGNLLRYGELGLGFARPFVEKNFKNAAERPKHPTASALILDDGSYAKWPAPRWYDESGTHRVGTTLDGVAGLLGYGFGAFRLHPRQAPRFGDSNLRTALRAAAPHTLRVVGFNLHNYFTTLARDADGRRRETCGPARDQGCRGAGIPGDRQRQRAKLVATLAALKADILGLVEVENTDDTALKDLVAGLNAAVGGDYDWVRAPFTGTDAIRVALVYRRSGVLPVGPAHATDPAIDRGFAAGFVALRRPALAQTFDSADGSLRFSVIVNHFKSKGGCPDDAGDPNADHGQGCWNLLRTEQAERLLRFADGVAAAVQSPHVLVIGDLNAYGGEDPIRTLEAGGLTDLIAARLPPEARYSYYDTRRAAFGYLDHALAGDDLADRIGHVHVWHTNSDEPRVLRYNDRQYRPGRHRPDPYGASDHDPVLIDIGGAAPAGSPSGPRVPPAPARD